MDSLLANYASDDDDGGDRKDSNPPSAPPSKPSSFFSSLPPPKSSSSSSSSSLFSSLPAPKSHQPNPSPNPPIPSPLQTLNTNRSNQDQKRTPTISSTFSRLPPPKSLPPNPKKIVQFTLPLNPSLLKSTDADDDEEGKERKPSKDSSNPAAPKALSAMLPAPKNSLCLAPPAASRKSVVESSGGFETKQERSDLQSYGGSKAEGFELEQEKSDFENYGSYPLEQGTGVYENYGSYDASSGLGSSYASGGSGDYGSYAENWADGSGAMAVATKVPDIGRILGKRGRNEIPPEIVEVKQDELIKNRPREDQVKLTGIAFGPSYQPVSTSKGKPTKLHKRKHQIGSLFFDMKQKEMELAERRSKGFLTKAETQAKYGW